MIVFTTGRFAITFDLVNKKIITKVESEGNYSIFACKKPLIFKDEKVLLGDQEISTYEDAVYT